MQEQPSQQFDNQVTDNECEVCGFLEKPKHQILVTKFWSTGLGNNHAYFGRAFVTLRTHKNSLSSLSEDEWKDFENVVKILEKAYKDAFGAEPLNWGCFMNNAYRVDPAHPHVHWHIFPRYKIAPVLDGIAFEDSLFGEFYDNDAEKLLTDDQVDKIAKKLVEHLGSL